MERYDSKNIVTIVTTVTERVKEREMKNVQISQELFLALVKCQIFFAGTGRIFTRDTEGIGTETRCFGGERVIYKV